MSVPMIPDWQSPEAIPQQVKPELVSLGDRVSSLQSLFSTGLPANIPLSPKPIRPQKARLPVAVGINETDVLNPQGNNATLPTQPIPQITPSAPQLAVSTSFNGVSDNGTSIPPDTAGAVGENHIFNPLNNEIGIFDRSGSELLSISLDNFWNTFHPGINTFDPKVVYDPFEHRFIFVSVADAQSATSSLLIAVTENDDPTGNWETLRIQVDVNQQGQVWLDYPSLGFSKDKITVQLNLFTINGNQFAGSSVYVFDKQEFYNPPHNPSVSLFNLPNQGGTQVPATTYDPNQTTQFLLSRWSSNFQGDGYLAAYEITGNVSVGNVQINRIGFIRIAGQVWQSFSPGGNFGPQLGTASKIDCGDDRLLSVVYRDNTLWCSHGVYLPDGSPTRVAAQWWEIDSINWSVKQFGRVEDPQNTKFYTYPTLSVNKNGDAVIGMSEFSALQHPSGAYAFRRSNDPVGQMSSPVVFAQGLNSYFKTFGGSSNRWGDYSATQVDPINDTDFWSIQEFASAQQNMWATKWIKLS